VIPHLCHTNLVWSWFVPELVHKNALGKSSVSYKLSRRLHTYLSREKLAFSCLWRERSQPSCVAEVAAVFQHSDDNFTDTCNHDLTPSTSCTTASSLACTPAGAATKPLFSPNVRPIPKSCSLPVESVTFPPASVTIRVPAA